MTKTAKRVLPRTLSPSSISTYEQCPKKFEYSRIDRLVDHPGRAMVLGTFAHGVLEDLMKLDPEMRTTEAAKRIARDRWDRWLVNLPDFVSLDLDETQQRNFRWDGWAAVEGYFQMEDPAAIQVIGLEQKVTVSIDEVPLMGIVDRIEKDGDETVVSDYKTGKVPGAKYKDGALLQPHLYAAMLAETGTNVDRVRLLYITHKSEVSGRISDNEVTSARQRATDTWGAINDDFSKDHFEALPSRLCDWCGFKSFCPAWVVD